MIKKKEEERRERKRFKGNKQNPNPLFSCVWVWIGFGEFLCKGNGEVSKELLSKFFKTHVLFLL